MTRRMQPVTALIRYALALPMSALYAAAGPTMTNLPPITVTADRSVQPWTHAVSRDTVTDIDALPGAGVTPQGGGLGQNDLSIRGSTFSGAGLSLAGLSLRNPQTEHFHLELPIPAAVLTSPDILTGLDQALTTDGHLVGTVSYNIPRLTDEWAVTAGGGERNRYRQDIIGKRTFARGDDHVGIGVFGGQESADSLDYDDNDVERYYGGGQLQWVGPDAQSDIIAARQWKEFGARGYYGVTTNWAAEEEIEDTLVAATHRQDGTGENVVRLSAAWRETRDRYTLFWALPGTFENRHTSTVVTAFADGVQGIDHAQRWSVRWRVGTERESVDSNSLGNHERRRGVVSLIPSYKCDAFTAHAGLRTEVFTDDAPAYLPQAGIVVPLRNGSTCYATYTATVRPPSYTELNYESPGSLGNAGLTRQESAAAEAGWRGPLLPGTVLRAAAFYRRSRDTVDWVLADDDSTRWTATDIGTVDTRGMEAEVIAGPLPSLDLHAHYMLLDKDEGLDVYASRYVLDYAEHRLTAAVVWRATDRVRVVATQTVQWQNANAQRAGDDVATPGTVSCFVRPRRTDRVELALTADNVWDDDFQILPGQKPTGRRVFASATVRW